MEFRNKNSRNYSPTTKTLQHLNLLDELEKTISYPISESLTFWVPIKASSQLSQNVL